jgi:hypothetical protein
MPVSARRHSRPTPHAPARAVPKLGQQDSQEGTPGELQTLEAEDAADAALDEPPPPEEEEAAAAAAATAPPQSGHGMHQT